MAHRSVSELAGQLQSQQGRLQSARNRIARIDGEVEQLVETLDASREPSREPRSKLEDAAPRMGELEDTRQPPESDLRTLAEPRAPARTAPRSRQSVRYGPTVPVPEHHGTP